MLWKAVMHHRCGRQISQMTVTFIVVVIGLWEVKDDLEFPKKRGRKGKSKMRREEDGKRSEERRGGAGWGESKEERFLNRVGSCIGRRPESSSSPRSHCDPALTACPTAPPTTVLALTPPQPQKLPTAPSASHPTPTSGLLHLPFPLPGMLFPGEPRGSALPSFSSNGIP